jgi:hypothetical protein
MTGYKNDLINYRIVRAKDTYDDALFNFDKDKVMPYFEPVDDFSLLTENMIKK